MGAETKAWMKKVVNAKKKKNEKEGKVYKKAWNKNQSLDIMRLALNNSQTIKVGTFKDILSNLSIASDILDMPTSHTSEPSTPLVSLKTLFIAKHILSDKKKTKSQALAGHFVVKGLAKMPKQHKLPTSLLVAIELIQPSKPKVKVPASAVKSTPPKRMREL